MAAAASSWGRWEKSNVFSLNLKQEEKELWLEEQRKYLQEDFKNEMMKVEIWAL